jgi:hypothetical protein
MGQIAGGLTSELLIFFPSVQVAILRVIRLFDFVSQLTAGLHAGSLVFCYNILASVYVSIADQYQEFRYVPQCKFTGREPVC